MRGETSAEEEHGVALRRLAERLRQRQRRAAEAHPEFVRGLLPGPRREQASTASSTLAPERPPPPTATLALLLDAVAGERPEAQPLLGRYLAASAADDRDSEWLPEMAQAAQTAEPHSVTARPGRDGLRRLTPYAGLFAVEGILAATWGCVDAYLAPLARLLGPPGGGPPAPDAAAASSTVPPAPPSRRRTRALVEEAGPPALSNWTARRGGRRHLPPRRRGVDAGLPPATWCASATSRACAISPTCWPDRASRST